MATKSVKKNAIISIIQSISSVLFPLITFPYVSRILGVDNLGAFNFSQSYVYYFSFLAGLGISTYAVREGARIREDRIKVENFITDVFSINVYSTLLSIILLIMITFFVPKFNGYKAPILILSVQIIFATVGRNWIYSIYEDYVFVAIRNIACQVVALVLMFALVRSEKDLNNYCIVSISSIVISNILNLIFSLKYSRMRFVFKPNLIHLKSIMLIFSMTVSIVIYSNTDITILGFFGTDYNVGLYGVSVKLYTMIKQIIAAGLTVTIPRFSYYLGKGDDKAYGGLFDNTYNTLLMILLPAISGLIIMSKEIVVLISGMDYIEAALSLSILSSSMLFNLIAYLLGYCILIPNRDEKAFFIATTVGAIVNVVLNFILIPLFFQNAAAATTLIAEAVAMIICFYKSKRHFRYSLLNKNLVSVSVGSLSIICVCMVLKYIIVDNYILRLIASIMTSVVVYFIILFIFRNKYFMNMISSFLSKVRKQVK